MRDEALKVLLEERWAAKYGREDPGDRRARSSRAVRLYEAGRWLEAARAFEEVLRHEGPASELAPPALYSLGYCRLALGDPRGSLEASALFLELIDEQHPLYRDAVRNIACAASLLGEQAALTSTLCSRIWILAVAFRLLGWRRKPLPRAPGRRRALMGAPDPVGQRGR
jgi:tetratricopeptide (TPR) repeat protein